MQLERQRQRQWHPAQQADDEVHQHQSGDGAERGDPEALDQQLLREPPPAGAERHANGNFTAADRRPREQQAGDIRAGNRKNQPDRHEEHREEGADGGHAAELFGRADRREERDLPELALTRNGDGLPRRHERRHVPMPASGRRADARRAESSRRNRCCRNPASRSGRRAGRPPAPARIPRSSAPRRRSRRSPCMGVR